MKYFVSIENCSYHLWQVELLIESFKRRGLDDDLVIGIAENPNPVVQRYTRNLLEHPHKFVHPNQNGPLNKFYALLLAKERNLLPKPFVIIHPDMVVLRPVMPFGDGFLIHPEPCFNELRQSLPYSIDGSHIIGIGEKVNEEVLFRNAFVHCSESKTDDPEMAAWMMAICEEVQRNSLPIKVDYLEQPMVTTDLYANFIHYKFGIPNMFHKKNFTFKGEAFLCEEKDPFDAIYKNDTTKSTHYMQKLIEFYRVRDDS